MTVSEIQNKPDGNDLVRNQARRVFVAGASGYIGRHVVRELVRQNYQVVCLVRRSSAPDDSARQTQLQQDLAGAELRWGEVTDAQSLITEGFRDDRFDVIVSCLTTRTGGIRDSWAIDHQANLNLLDAGRSRGAGQFVLLSAMCVQKPKLAFQHAKLAFEKVLMSSGMTWSIVRPTAFLKSLSGQIPAVQQGKPFLLFGDGKLTACKPIAESDLARFMVECITDSRKHNRILPVGGPGSAITPIEQGRLLFELTGKPEKFRHIPVSMFSLAIAFLNLFSFLSPRIRDKAEFARIGRYYATESMLVIHPDSGRYDAASTPSYGSITLRDHYRRVLDEGLAGQELGGHKLFR